MSAMASLQQLRHIVVCARATSAVDTHDVITLSSQHRPLSPWRAKAPRAFFRRSSLVVGDKCSVAPVWHSSMSEMAWLRQSSCKLANDLQECSSLVRRASTSASAPEPAVLHLQFCSHLCIFPGVVRNHLASLARSSESNGCKRRRQGEVDSSGDRCCTFCSLG